MIAFIAVPIRTPKAFRIPAGNLIRNPEGVVPEVISNIDATRIWNRRKPVSPVTNGCRNPFRVEPKTFLLIPRVARSSRATLGWNY